MNVEQVKAHRFEEQQTRYSQQDCMLYGLGVNACQNPLNDSELSFVYESNLQALPSLSCVLAHPGMWLKAPELDINVLKLVHAEQSFRLEKPLPAAGEVVARYEIRGVTDKGEGKGALMYFRKSLRSVDGEPLGQVDSTYFLRGDGGCGDWGEGDPAPEPVPEAPADGHVDTACSPLSALIYRLSGDYNPLHADPEVARKAGFEKPILHGLCTYGMACQALVKAVCNNEAGRLQGMSARFTRPFYPGETLRTEFWRENGKRLRFRCISLERNEVVLDRGSASLTD